jgi:flagellar basal body-associated protein FliL
MKISCAAIKVALLILRGRRSSSKVCAAKQSQPESARARLRLTEKCAGDFSPARDKLSNLGVSYNCPTEKEKNEYKQHNILLRNNLLEILTTYDKVYINKTVRFCFYFLEIKIPCC